MDDFRARYGPWAVVAGASVGLGAELARQLAARRLNLVLLARGADSLSALAAELERDHRVEVRHLALDLADPEVDLRVAGVTQDLEVGLLAYNAAHSQVGDFLDHPVEVALRTLDVNCRGPLFLCHRFGAGMRARGRGGIVLMTSLAASQGSPLLSVYAATKAFNLVLAEGLWDELRRHGVDVVACRAGATRTPGFAASRPVGSTPMMDPAPVVRATLAALGRGPSLVPGWLNRVAAFLLARLLPRRAAIRIMGRATRKLYGRT